MKTNRPALLATFKNVAVVGARAVSLWMALLLLGVVLALGSPYLTSGVEDEAPLAADQSGWGSEALSALGSGAEALSPVPLANACGLGASSCFRCHNGKRAEAPASDPNTAPWHHQHASVNYSCAGCHQGNPRILKQEIAHKNLLANPVSAPEQACAGCHVAGEVDGLADRYRKILGN